MTDRTATRTAPSRRAARGSALRELQDATRRLELAREADHLAFNLADDIPELIAKVEAAQHAYMAESIGQSQAAIDAAREAASWHGGPR